MAALLLLASGRLAAGGFCDDRAGGFAPVFSDEFDGELDAASWNVEVAPPSETEGDAAAARGLRERARVGADCSGQGCISLGSCREASCTGDNAYVQQGKLLLRSQRHAGEARPPRC